ncbi:hypothetical protein M233_07860 [Xylella fastidiosa subsp. multiplex Griffin-1]|nr:hypothetical protein M233_07860 [Xylella fastidiosa subsp. multiplex Griffin-1]KAF0571365.1 hypothetical protein P305_05025 [Xylella fastidiosa subsp. fastidiosa Mus-1]
MQRYLPASMQSNPPNESSQRKHRTKRSHAADIRSNPILLQQSKA